MRNWKIDLTPMACFYGALLLLLLPLRWILAAAFAAAFHELCHYLALRFCGVGILEIRIGAGGTVMETEPMGAKQELLCTMAGPLGSLSLLLWIKFLPLTAICGMIQGLFNLLPLFPLDGGRMARCAFGALSPRYGARISLWVERATMAVMVLALVYGAVRFDLGLLPFLMILLVLGKGLQRKIPCKDDKLRVQ